MWLTNNILQGILLTNNKACCLCLQDTNEDTLFIYDKVVFDDTRSLIQLSTIICTVFHNKISEKEFVSYAVCDECVKSVINAYKFINKCTEINDNLRSTLCNITKSLENAEYNNAVNKSVEVFIALDPKSLVSKAYYDSERSVQSISILLTKFQSLVYAERPFYNNGTDSLYDDTESVQEERKRNKSRSKNLKRVSCKFCGRSYCNKYILKTHLLKNCKKFREYKHFEGVNTNNSDIDLLLNLHKDVNLTSCFDSYCCHYCDKSFKTKMSLKIHIHHHCKNTPIDIKRSICSICGKVVNRFTMTIHLQTHSSPFECTKCSKVFKTKKAYKKHMLIPNCKEKPLEFNRGPKTFSCKICGSQFSVKRSLSDHMKARHSGPGFECPVCKKKLATNYALKLHMVVHTKEKNFVCSVCGKKFVSRHSLLYHTRTHTGETPYKCKFCEKRFLSASRRNIHIRIHHLPPQLECKYCMKKFTNWGTLSRHRKRHFNPGSSLYLEDLNELIQTQKSETEGD